MGWFDDKQGNPLDQLFTWGAETFTPTWCQTEEHWTSRLTDYLYTDCPCCLMWRALIVGFIFGTVMSGACALGAYLLWG
jgi:hypothetical protein